MATPLDAERARLRALGHTEAEISQILILQEAAKTSPLAAGAAPVQGTMTGTTGNLAAAASFVRNFVPGMVADFGTMRNPAAASQARGQAAVYLALKVVVILVVAYVISLELRQLKASVWKVESSVAPDSAITPVTIPHNAPPLP